jgi:tetratricopeptide (TPR) repeat protein
MVHRLAALLALSGMAAADPGVARNAHFEVYAQDGAENARAVLGGFERLRSYFLQQTGIRFSQSRPVRIIAFHSRAEYEPYELGSTADAYYVATESRDTIVLPAGRDGDIRVAAHEYAHFALHASGLEVPPWLNEGLAEFFATVRLGDRGTKAEAPLQSRARVLKARKWIPLSELVTLPADAPLRQQRDAVDLFYAECWALTDMLMSSPGYRLRFLQLVRAVSSGVPSDRALSSLYGDSLEEITADLQRWIEKHRGTPVTLPAVAPGDLQVESSGVSPLGWQSAVAELLLETGKWDQAQTSYAVLSREAPGSGDYPAALALIELHQHDLKTARQSWQTAVGRGVQDAALCYRYAVLANTAGLPEAEIRSALERAVAVQPDFDNALYMLAHLDNNADRYESAVAHLRAMRAIAPARQFAYWAAMAYALGELGRRDEAKAAAGRAAEHAATDEERARAAQLAEIAETDLNVQFTHDANGHARLVTTRVPHGAQNWNPFIEPGDRIRRAVGKLRQIECGGSATRLVVETRDGLVSALITDPQRVQMLRAPSEFTCGPQPGASVTLVYALADSTNVKGDGIVRGIEFH